MVRKAALPAAKWRGERNNGGGAYVCVCECVFEGGQYLSLISVSHCGTLSD